MYRLRRAQPFLFSLLLHALILASMLSFWFTSPNRSKPPSMYVPSYAYQEPPSQSAPAMQEQPKAAPQKAKPVPPQPVADKGEISISREKQLSHASEARTSTTSKVSEAINLVGDKKTVPKPLIKILARALSAKLTYPKIAVDFHVHGIAYVEFTLHPDGTVTQVAVVQSSQAGVLDGEAVRAIEAMSPVKGVSEFVNKPKMMVIGIIFR